MSTDLFSPQMPLGVVPVLMGPLQALMLVLPQIVLGVMLGARALASPLVWRGAAGRAGQAVRARPLRTAAWLAGAALLSLAASWALVPVESGSDILPLPAAGGSWPTFHGAPDRCGVAAPTSAPLGPRTRWKFCDALVLERRPLACSPAIAAGRVVIGSDNYKCYAVDLETGQLSWMMEARWPIFSSPAISEGRVYIGEGLHENTDSRFYCLDLASGKVLWDIQTRSHTESSPTVAEGKVFFGAGDDGVYCADASTGRVLWRHAGPHVDGAPLVAGGHVYVGSGYQFCGVLCLDAGDGRPVWRKALPAAVWGAPSLADGRLYVAAGNGTFVESADKPYGEVRCLDPRTGEDIWRFTAVKDAVLTSVAVTGGRAVFSSRDGGCYALDAATGALAWTVQVGAPVLSSPAVVGGQVLFGADDGKFRCLALDDGRELWQTDTSDDTLLLIGDSRIQSSPAVAAGKILFGSSNGRLYCLEADGPAQGTPATAAFDAAARYRTRLMRGADMVITGFIRGAASVTGSHGLAVVLAAFALKLLLLPFDWRLARQQQKIRLFQGEVDRLQRECVDYRVHRYLLRELYASHNIRPLAALAAVAVQVPLFVVVFLVLQGTLVFEGRPFLWMADLGRPDRLAVPWPGAALNILPLVLAAAIWLFSMTLAPAGGRQGLPAKIAWALLAAGLAVFAYRWSAALLLFTIALLAVGMLQQKVLLALPVRARGEGQRP